MSQWSVSFSGLNIPGAFESQIGFSIQSITIYNNTPAQIAILSTLPSGSGSFPFGGTVVPAFYPITIPAPGWSSVAFKTDGTGPFAASSLSIFASDQPPGGNPLSPFGPSGWGAGSDPSVLTQINPGDAILAWQIRQFYFFLTGGLPGDQTIQVAEGQQFHITDDTGATVLFSVDEPSGLVAMPAGASVTSGLTVDSLVATNTPNSAIFQGLIDLPSIILQTAGQHAYWLRTNTGRLELLDNTRVRVILTVYDSGGIFYGDTPVDPGDNILGVQGRITANAVGASAKTLLNRVYLPDPPPLTVASGNGNKTFTSLALTGLPSSAVGAVILAQLQCATVGSGLFLGPNGQTVSSLIVPVVVSGQNGLGQGTIAVSGGNVNYQVLGTAGAAWGILLYLIAYDEPS